jgi:hypothetical protein
MLQTLVVAGLVGWCGVFALWTLAPKGLRRRLAMALLQWPLPSIIRAPLAAAARQQGGCGCDGCDRAAPAGAQRPVPVLQPIRIIRPGASRTRH